jgi:hypothetical protein
MAAKPGTAARRRPGGFELRRHARSGESNKFVYEGDAGTHKWYDGTQHPWEFKRVWHLEPSLTDPDIAYAGVEDAAIFKTADGGKTWKELARVAPGQGPSLAAGRGRHGRAHHSSSIPRTRSGCLWPSRRVAPFRTEDGGKTWRPALRAGSSRLLNCRTPTRKSGIACIALPFIRRARTFCSCKSIGT